VSITNFTVEFDALANRQSTGGLDSAVQALVGTVTFTPVMADDKPIMAPLYDPRAAGFKFLPTSGYIDSDGRLRDERSGSIGVRLWANDPVFNLDKLVYRVSFSLSTAVGLDVPVEGGFFEAPAEDETVNLSEVLESSTAGSAPAVYELGDVASAFGTSLVQVGSAAAARELIDAVSDFDPRLDDERATIDGSVTVAKLAENISTQVGNLGSTLFVTSSANILNADTDDDDTTKTCRLGVPHYSADEDPFLGVRLTSTSATNVVDVGGNTLTGTAANQVRIWTAADNVTAGGTERLRIDNNGATNVYGKLATAASASGSAGLIVPHGSAPSAPVDGDVWTTTAGMWVRVNGASERLAGFIDSDDDDRLSSGEATLKRRDCTSNVNTNSGNLRLTYFKARKTETITAIRTFSANTAQVGATLCRVGIYEEDPDTGDLTLVASIANDTGLWASTLTAYPVSLSASFVKTRGTRYAVGSLVVGASAYPTLPGQQATVPPSEMGQSPKQGGLLGGQTDLPASISAALVGDSTLQHYTVLVP
jgi:hypothetical protein